MNALYLDYHLGIKMLDLGRNIHKFQLFTTNFAFFWKNGLKYVIFHGILILERLFDPSLNKCENLRISVPKPANFHTSRSITYDKVDSKPLEKCI